MGTQSMSDTYLKSTFIEQLVEHVFIAEVLQETWYGFGKTVEVLHSEVDASGYDLVFDCNGILRHVQLKTSKPNKKGAQPVNVALGEKPSGCVVWIFRQEDPDTRRMNLSFRFFGGGPGEPLPSLEEFPLGRRTTPNKEGNKPIRHSIRKVPYRRFITVPSTTTLVEHLFGLTIPDANDPTTE
jgi:hypothetical protein